MSIDGNAARVDFAGIEALRSRPAGFAVAKKCVEVQRKRELLDPSLRDEHGVRLHDEAVSWYLGTLGELEVGKMLDSLGPEWLVLHSVPIGKGTKDVDHLVVGPAGVFAINTKHRSRARVWIGDWMEKVNGSPEHYGRASLNDSSDIATRLGQQTGATVAVNSVIALVGINNLTDARAAAHRRVNFIPADELLGWLRGLPPTLTPAQLGLLRLAAEDPSTWHSDPTMAYTSRAMPKFERLREDVERRRAWAAEAPDARARRTRGTAGSRPARRPQPAIARRTPGGPSAARIVVTIVLAAVALAVLVPLAVMLAFFGASNPNLLVIALVVVLIVIGLAVPGTSKKRRRRRR